MHSTTDQFPAEGAIRTHGPYSGCGAESGTVDEPRLREVLKRCSPPTIEAARELRLNGNLEYLPAFVTGVIERFVEPDLRPRLAAANGDLRLIEDLGLDSLTLMEIVMLAEDVLAISITNTELHHLVTLGDVQLFIADKLRLPAGLPRPASETATAVAVS